MLRDYNKLRKINMGGNLFRLNAAEIASAHDYHRLIVMFLLIDWSCGPRLLPTHAPHTFCESDEMSSRNKTTHPNQNKGSHLLLEIN